MASHISGFIEDGITLLKSLDAAVLDKMVEEIAALRERGGRLFIVGVGGSAANASHAVSDFRKLADIEAYSPVDNTAELMARTNDEGWDTIFEAWLVGSRLNDSDALMVFSVGGGSVENALSVNIVRAVDLARERGATVMGVVGNDGGHTAKTADICLRLPTANPSTKTAHAEAFQAFVWHLLTSDPRLMRVRNKWESMEQSNP